jgi:hypothetical protein
MGSIVYLSLILSYFMQRIPPISSSEGRALCVDPFFVTLMDAAALANSVGTEVERA